MSKPHHRPQLSPDELQQLKWVMGGLLTVLAVSTVFYMDVDAWTLMGLTIIATIAVVVRPDLPGRVPKVVHTLAFPAIVLFFAADLWLRTEVLPAMVRLDILLLLYRTISYRQRRDDLQIIVLGLFLIIVAGVLTVSLLFAVQILAYTACALLLLLLVTLSDAAHSTQSSTKPIAPGTTPSWAQHADWSRVFHRLRTVTDWRIVALGGSLFAGVVAVSALLFLAIPRFQLENSMFMERFISKKARSGFSENIRFGDVTEIQQDNSVALSVDISDHTQIPATPYWRMLVLDQYDNGAFKLSAGLRGQEFPGERQSSYLHGFARPRRGESTAWTFFLESGVSRYLPLLGHFDMLRFRESQFFSFAPGMAVMRLREDPVSMTAYRVEGFDMSPSLPDPAFAQRWRQRSLPDQRRHALQFALGYLYEGDRVALARIVADVTRGTKVAAGNFAREASAWLRQHHGYTLDPRIPAGDGDVLVRWMTSREAGHCELFAGAFVMLARTAGFPSRVVTGFRGGSWNGYSNNFTIRNSDAHAWAEIFDEEAGAWLRADPLAVSTSAATEEIRGEAALVSRLDRSWTARLDSLRVFWYRRIVSFDQRSQGETLKAVKDATQNSGRRMREALSQSVDELKAWLAQPWDVRRVGKVLAVIAAAGGLVWLWRAWVGRWWQGVRKRSRGEHYEPERREAGKWLLRLMPLLDHTSESERVIVAELQRLRFGRRDAAPSAQRVFRQARHVWRAARRRARAAGTARQ